MLDAARRAAVERAKPSRPSVDEAEQGRLEELRRQLEAARRAVESAPAWKRWAASVFPRTELARQNAAIFRLATEIRAQEDLVRDLADVLPIDSIVEAMRDRVSVSEEQMAMAFRQIRQALEVPRLFGRSDIPRTNEERAAARKSLERMAASGGKSRAKWADAGLRLLSGYEAANPIREDARARVDAARAAEYVRTGPMELVDGKWVRISGVVRPDVRKPPLVSIRREEPAGEELLSK
ncbi:hypothetical protein EBS80_04700 [bacterium]|nr:hypothetical protein [bacterium]